MTFSDWLRMLAHINTGNRKFDERGNEDLVLQGMSSDLTVEWEGRYTGPRKQLPRSE
jgi:hypothetical protein